MCLKTHLVEVGGGAKSANSGGGRWALKVVGVVPSSLDLSSTAKVAARPLPPLSALFLGAPPTLTVVVRTGGGGGAGGVRLRLLDEAMSGREHLDVGEEGWWAWPIK